MGMVLIAARLSLAGVFGVAGLAKLHDVRGSQKSLIEFGVPGALTPALPVLLSVSELACAIAMLLNRWAVPGAIGAIALLAVFSAGITVSLIRGQAPHCHCFGQLSSSPVSWWSLARNLVLLSLALIVANRADQIPPVWPGLFGNLFEVALLAAIGALAAGLMLTLWFLFHLLQQNGRLMLRLEVVEKSLNIDPNSEPVQGLPLGVSAPAFDLRALEGGMVSLKALGETNKPVLLLFTEQGCGACQSLAPEISRWQKEYAEQVIIVLVSRSQEQLNRAESAAHGLSNLLLQVNREVEQAYGVTATPSAVLVAEGKIASRIASGSDAIRTLVARAMMPPLLKIGDTVPSVKLPDLDGKILDLATLHGRQTLLLFWNPSCRFCQEMLLELKTWKRPQTAPEVVVISSGSPEASRDQGFRVRVLVDRSLGSGHVFGASATPSAVLLDEDGRVASEVGVGAPAVFALAGVGVRSRRP